jgi:uncharacterized protein (TIGR02757 family)
MGKKAMTPTPLEQLDFEAMREATETQARLQMDPLGAVPRGGTLTQQELAAFIAAGLAFGNVQAIHQSVHKAMAIHLYGEEQVFHGHRWVRGGDLAAIVTRVRALQDEYGSLGASFLVGYERGDMRGSLTRFSALLDAGLPKRRGVQYLCTSPAGGSACKRLNLFLRWVVRTEGVDLGLWTDVSPADLIVPLDVHVLRFAQHHGLTGRRAASWLAAEEVTAWFRQRWPTDPLRYDFAISHSGMMRGVQGGAP